MNWTKASSNVISGHAVVGVCDALIDVIHIVPNEMCKMLVKSLGSFSDGAHKPRACFLVLHHINTSSLTNLLAFSL